MMAHMKNAFTYELRDPREIEPSPWNANVVSHENEEKLRASIERHGMFKPILVREIGSPVRYQCIGGWHRCEQAVELGYPEIPTINLGVISDERAKEISLADNARYGIDDTLKLSELLEDLDRVELEATLPWTSRDIAAITASLSVDVADLDLDAPIIDDHDDDEEQDAPVAKAPKTHQLLKFRVPIADAARVSDIITRTMNDQGFTKDDAMTNAGEALAFVLLQGGSDAAS